MSKRPVILVLLGLLFTCTPQTLGYFERAGWQAELETLDHLVSGTVTILDQDTCRVDNFNYDGTGIDDYFYLGTENASSAFANGLQVGPDLLGPAFVDASLVIDLPPGETFEGYNAISVWCVPAGANFGSGEFGEVVGYKVTFDGNWNAIDHPTDYPGNAHFSALIGGTHNENVAFWTPYTLASPGIENMSETGDKNPLNDEINAEIEPANAGNAFSLISGGEIGSGTGSVSKTFEIRTSHPLVTLTSMVAPSPDWFVGVHDLPLYENGEWRKRVVVELFPWDAGTEEGTTFSGCCNPDTVPQEPISRIFGPPFENTPPLGTFTFTLVGACPYILKGDINGDCRVDLIDFAIVSCNWLIDCNTTPNDPACRLIE